MSKNEHVLSVVSSSTKSESPLEGLDELFASAAKQNLHLSIVSSSDSPEAEQARSKARHDLVGALRTLSMAKDSFENGYKFDDDLAEAKIAAIGRATAALEKNISPLLELLDS